MPNIDDLDELKRVIAAGTRSAANVFARKTKELAPKRQGRLRGSIITYRLVRHRKDEIGYTVGVSRGAFYWRFLEAGFVPRRPSAFSKVRPRRFPRKEFVRFPFIEPAFNQAQAQAFAAFERTVEEKLK